MAQIVGLPKLSPTMEEGVLIKWVLAEGESVEPGQLIAEIETDKANMDFALEDEGTLLKFLVPEGATVKLGAPLLILGEAGEDITAIVKEAQTLMASSSSETSASASFSSTPAPVEEKEQPISVVGSQKEAVVSTGRILASPLAKTLGIELGIDLRVIQGSGPGGRIIERDVRAASQEGVSAGLPASSPSLALKSKTPSLQVRSTEGYVDKPLSNIRKTIAARLTAAKQEIPHYRLATSFEAGPMLQFRKRLNALMQEGKVSVNDILIKGVALALRRVPEVNVAYMGDSIRYFDEIHVGVAVALERGLLTPVVRNADQKGLGSISFEVKDLIGRAKDRKLKAHEITGSTFTISNLGMFGIDQFDAIINPPEAAILAVGRIQKQPVFDADGTVTVGQRMTLTMSCDHRVVDGAIGARFLDQLVELLESPEALAL